MIMNTLKKLSPKTIAGNVKSIMSEVANGETIALYTVFGQTVGMKSGSTNFGDWISFTGRFEAINAITSEVSQGFNLFLPEMAQDMVQSALGQDGVSALELGFEIGARKDDTLPMGYEYTVKPLIQPTDDDPLARLRDQVQKAALPAPEKVAKAPKKD